MRLHLALGLLLGTSTTAAVIAAPVESSITIAQLLSEGWDIAGYVGTADVRSTLILFRDRDRKRLVQCSVFYDVTRSPHEATNCYEVR